MGVGTRFWKRPKFPTFVVSEVPNCGSGPMFELPSAIKVDPENPRRILVSPSYSQLVSIHRPADYPHFAQLELKWNAVLTLSPWSLEIGGAVQYCCALQCMVSGICHVRCILFPVFSLVFS